MEQASEGLPSRVMGSSAATVSCDQLWVSCQAESKIRF